MPTSIRLGYEFPRHGATFRVVERLVGSQKHLWVCQELNAKPGMRLLLTKESILPVERCCLRCRRRGVRRAPWRCRTCGRSCCEHLCALKEPDGTACCGSCRRR